MKLQISDWDQSYSNNKTPWREERPDVEKLIAKSGISSGAALDLGCGTGEWGIALAEKGFEVEGIDFSEEALKIARAQSDKVTWVKWDLEHLNNYGFKPIKYDLILDHKTFAHIEDKDKYLRTIKSHLGGVYVLTVYKLYDDEWKLCVTDEDVETMIKPILTIIDEVTTTPRPGKTFTTYYLK